MPQLFVRRLTVLDFAYLDSERGLLGESWMVDIELGGELDEQAMVLDFADVKRAVKRLIDAEFDHRLLVPADYAGLSIETDSEQTQLSFQCGNQAVIKHQSPHQAVALIPGDAISEHSVARAIEARLRAVLPERVEQIRLDLRPEQHDSAYFHYAHGLKQHVGNCQRIAHGHRSRLEISQNGQRDGVLEREWAENWRDIYIATEEDLVASETTNGGENYIFAYHSAQGDFRLSLPQSHCFLLPTESTIERLAEHLAVRLKQAHPQNDFRVRLFEGIDKGALSSA